MAAVDPIGQGSARDLENERDQKDAALVSKNEAFRAAPHFDASVERVTEASANERLLAVYEVKYKGSFDGWRDKMRDGFASGDRVLLRYTPA